MINSGDLKNRDFDRNEPKGADAVHADMERVKGHASARTLDQRIAEARSLTPPDGSEPESWAAGRDAALKAIEAS